ncbi:LysR family transcriptional regulator [Tumidithrix elongata RA019]|uniref:LysR family transcriptional regulator n=1 Tax=Tumidithrix elongata BACA0141 TaxID=2716417 RepID=A0AAW9PYD2_9CYAN|nr:LysR family transcriptional regulator [Tumidithrix elongata RA019]
MRLEQLQAFLAVVETGSFQQASQKCDVNQSTVSRQIQSLEASLGIQLFHRGASAKVTIGGERLLPHARKICQEWKNVEQELNDLQAGKQTELCVAAIPSACAYQLPPVLQSFAKTYPNVQLRVTTLGSDRALKVLKDGLIDLAVVMNNPFLTSSSEMVVDLLYEESIQVLMAADHPLSCHQQVTWKDLDRHDQVVFKDGYGLQRLVQEQFNRQGLHLNAVLELNSLDAFRGVIRQGDLIALLPATALKDVSNDPSLAVREIVAPTLTRQIVLVTTGDRLQIPPIYHFRKLTCELIQSKNRILSEQGFYTSPRSALSNQLLAANPQRMTH